MPLSESLRALDEVDGHLGARRERSVRRPRRDLLQEDFSWSEPRSAKTPAADAAVTEAPVATEVPVVTARRTVVITGRGSERYVSPRRGGYEGRLRPHERSSFKPDRLGLWAVLLCLALLLGAVTSSHAAVLHTAVHAAAHLR